MTTTTKTYTVTNQNTNATVQMVVEFIFSSNEEYNVIHHFNGLSVSLAEALAGDSISSMDELIESFLIWMEQDNDITETENGDGDKPTPTSVLDLLSAWVDDAQALTEEEKAMIANSDSGELVIEKYMDFHIFRANRLSNLNPGDTMVIKDTIMSTTDDVESLERYFSSDVSYELWVFPTGVVDVAIDVWGSLDDYCTEEKRRKLRNESEYLIFSGEYTVANIVETGSENDRHSEHIKGDVARIVIWEY